MNRYSCLLLFGISLSLIQCQTAPDYQEVPRVIKGNEAIVSGQIQQPQQQASLTVQVLRNNDQQTLRADQQGNFQDTFTLRHPSFVQLVHRGQSSYGFIKPGDSLYLTFQSGALASTLEFSGNRKRPNNYLARKQQYVDTLGPQSRRAQNQWFTQEPEAFSQSLDSLKNYYQAFYQDYFREQLPSEVFHQLEQANINHYFYRQKKLYPGYYRRLKTGRYPDVSEEFKQYQDKVSFQKARLFGVPSYQRYVRSVVNRRAQKRMEEKKEKARSVILKNVVEETLPNDTLQARVLGRFLLQSLKTNGPTSVQGVLSYYRQLPHSKPMMERLDGYLQRWSRIAEGQPAPGFSYPSFSGDTVSLESLKGSYVYIDAWATWCKPCIKEIPYLKTLQDAYERDEVRFVSISLDDAADRGKWRRLVETRDLQGLQLFAGGEAFDADFARDYLINSIPRFILIGPDGRVVDPKAQRPSGNIQVRLDKLLSKGAG